MFQHHSAQQAGREDADEEHFPSAGTQTEPEDPMGSVNGQQFEGTQGSTGVASSPTAVSGGVGREEGGDGGAQLGEATPRMPPPPPSLSSQPLPFPFHGGYPTEQQTGGADISFATESVDATAAVNASGVNPGLSASIPAPPIPPPTFNPYYAPFRSPYHMNPYGDSSPMSHPAYGCVPPLSSSFAPSFPHGHFSNSPLLRPNHLPGYPYRSPMSYPPHHYHHPQWGDHPSPPRAAMFGSPGQGPPPAHFAPPFPPHPPPPRVSPYPPPSLMHHLLPLAHPPFGGHLPPSFPPVGNFNTSLVDGSGLGNVRPSTLLPSQAQLRGGPFSRVMLDNGLGLHSPSGTGTTAASLQVHPPSSPPSVPSINLQQPSTSNLNNCNAASVAMPNLETTNSSTGMTASLPIATSTAGMTLQIPAVSPTGGANSTPALVQCSLAASNSGVSTLELGPGPGPGPDTASSFPSLVKPIDFTKETGAASLLAWKGHAFGSVSSGPMTTGGEITVEGAEQGAEGDHRLAVEKEESVSSLPVSIPEELRCV